MSLLTSLTVLAVLFLLCSTYLIRFRLEQNALREKENTKFLTADLNARNESEKLSIEKDRTALLAATLRSGHSPRCTYCCCGYSNTRVEAEKALKVG